MIETHERERERQTPPIFNVTCSMDHVTISCGFIRSSEVERRNAGYLGAGEEGLLTIPTSRLTQVQAWSLSSVKKSESCFLGVIHSSDFMRIRSVPVRLRRSDTRSMFSHWVTRSCRLDPWSIEVPSTFVPLEAGRPLFSIAPFRAARILYCR